MRKPFLIAVLAIALFSAAAGLLVCNPLLRWWP